MKQFYVAPVSTIVFSVLFLTGCHKELSVEENLSARYNDSAFNYLGKSIDTSLYYTQVAIREAKSQNLPKELARGYIGMGNVMYYQGYNDSATMYYYKSLEISTQNKYKTLEAKALNNLAMIADVNGNYQEALRLYHQSLEIRLKDTIYSDIAASYNNIGLVYYFMGNYDKAISYMQLSCEHEVKAGNLPGEAATIINIANIFYEMGNYDLSKKYYQQSLSEFQRVHDLSGQASALNNIGSIYQKYQLYDSARFCFYKGLQLARQIGNQQDVATGHNNLGKLYIESGQLLQGRAHLDTALLLASKSDEKHLMARTYKLLADLDCREQKFENAIKKYTAARQLSEMHEMNQINLLLYHSFYEYFKQAHNTDSALTYLEKHNLLRDTLYNESMNRQITELQTKYETTKKEAQLAAMSKENELQKIKIDRTRKLLYASGALLVLLISIALLGILIFRERTRRQSLELEHRLLRSQMNPHFIFNALAAIQQYVIANDALTGARFISRFALLMRQILEGSRTEFIPFDREIETIRAYLDLQKLRLEGKMDYTLTLPDEDETYGLTVPVLILQPFIENAIEHGIRPMPDGGRIDIVYQLQPATETLMITLTDNGVGRDTYKTQEVSKPGHQSLATSITQKRLELLNKKLGHQTKAYFRYTDLANIENRTPGTRVEIILPLIYK